jgi:hypothetical protein
MLNWHLATRIAESVQADPLADGRVTLLGRYHPSISGSNTEPLHRLNLEAASQALMQEKRTTCRG